MIKKNTTQALIIIAIFFIIPNAVFDFLFLTMPSKVCIDAVTTTSLYMIFILGFVILGSLAFIVVDIIDIFHIERHLLDFKADKLWGLYTNTITAILSLGFSTLYVRIANDLEFEIKFIILLTLTLIIYALRFYIIYILEDLYSLEITAKYILDDEDRKMINKKRIEDYKFSYFLFLGAMLMTVGVISVTGLVFEIVYCIFS